MKKKLGMRAHTCATGVCLQAEKPTRGVMKLNHRLWKVIYFLCMWLGLEIGMTIHGHSQTLDCYHDSSTIEYYDNLRLIPGTITDIKGIEVTLKVSDKHQVVVRTFHLTDLTKFYTEKNMVATQVDRAYFEKHKDGCWMIRYCAHCLQAYKLVRVEV